MDTDLKALHDAVTDFLSARRGVKRAAQARRRVGDWWVGASGWEGLHFIDQLDRDEKNAQSALDRAENEVLNQWAVFNRLPKSRRHESERNPDDSAQELERLVLVNSPSK